MHCKSLVLALTAVSAIASAQPGPPAGPPAPPMDSTTNTNDPGPPDTSTNTQTTPPVQNTAPPPQQTVEPVQEPDGDRPAAFSIAIGIGYSTPMDLQMPNISSARLRLASGLTFEPVVRLESVSHNMDPAAGMSTTDKTTRLLLGSLVRLPLVKHGKVDLEALGVFTVENVKTNPEGDYNAITTTDFVIGYGVAVTYWLSQHWNLSLSTTNPILDYSNTKTQLGMPNLTAKTSDTTLGIIFTPDVFMMIHLYN